MNVFKVLKGAERKEPLGTMNTPLEARVKQDFSPQACSPEALADVQRVRQALPTAGHAMETETPISTGEPML